MHKETCQTIGTYVKQTLTELMETPFTSVRNTLCQKQPNNRPAMGIYAVPCQKEALFAPSLPSFSPSLSFYPSVSASLAPGAIRAWRGERQLLSPLLQQLAAKWQANDESPFGLSPERYCLCCFMGEGIMNDVGQALRPPLAQTPISQHDVTM